MNDAKLNEALNAALEKIDLLWEDMNGMFPSHNSENNKYYPVENDNGWNTGFWTGMLWLAYEATGDEKYRLRAESTLPSFYYRIEHLIGVDHHDMGFLYVPSCVAAYKLTGNEDAKNAALLAADHLMTRYNKEGGYIQAWGKIGEQLRLIIDCMNNIPLLFWAHEVTGDKKYYDAAYNHAKTTLKYIIREDYSTFHTFYFNPDGTPDKGATAQGAGDDSCWARGQAWIISGLPIMYKYVHEDYMLELHEKLTQYFLDRLPQDHVPYWDLIFTSGDEERDSSAAAIAVCGMLEMLHYQKDEGVKAKFETAIDEIMSSLYDNYSTKNTDSNGLLLHAVYTKPGNVGVDECNIWGCYYYMEALVRMIKGTRAYW